MMILNRFVIYALIYIMHQHPILTHKVSMAVLNFKVVHKDRFSKLFNLKVGNFNLITVSGNKCVTNFKITCGYNNEILSPISAFGRNNSFLIKFSSMPNSVFMKHEHV